MFRRYFWFQGRAGRLELAIIFMTGLLLGLFLIEAESPGGVIKRSAEYGLFENGGTVAQSDIVHSVVDGVLAVLRLLLLYVTAAAFVRRLHDLGRSGAQYFLLLIPFYNVYLLLVLLFRAGQAGENRFGLPPEVAGIKRPSLFAGAVALTFVLITTIGVRLVLAALVPTAVTFPNAKEAMMNRYQTVTSTARGCRSSFCEDNLTWNDSFTWKGYGFLRFYHDYNLWTIARNGSATIVMSRKCENIRDKVDLPAVINELAKTAFDYLNTESTLPPLKTIEVVTNDGKVLLPATSF